MTEPCYPSLWHDFSDDWCSEDCTWPDRNLEECCGACGKTRAQAAGGTFCDGTGPHSFKGGDP